MPFSKDDTTLCRLPWLDPEDRRRRYDAVARLSDDYAFEAEVTITDYGNWASATRRESATTASKDQIDKLTERFAASVQNVTLENYQTGGDTDSAWTSFILKGQPTITEAGELCLLKADFFHGDSPDDFSKKEREHPIWFGGPALVETHISWSLPDGMSFEPGSDVIADSCAGASLRCETTAEGGNLEFTTVTTYYGEQMPPENYDQARSFDRKSDSATRYRAIITKDTDEASNETDSL
jgi:hypothetical protein